MSRPAPAFPPIILLNLDRDADRLAHMRAELGRAGVDFVRLPGVLGRAFPSELAPYFAGAGQSLKAGEVGCYASDLLAMRAIASGVHGACAIVMEDDLEIAGDFADTVQSLLERLPPGWDFVRLSNKPKRAVVEVCALGGARRLVKYSKVPNGAGAYLVSREGAGKFVVERSRARAVDEDLRRPWEFDLRVFGVEPAPVAHSSASHVSSIDTVEAGRLDGRSGVWGRLKRTQWGEFPRRPLFNIGWLGFRSWRACLKRNVAARMRWRVKPPQEHVQ